MIARLRPWWRAWSTPLDGSLARIVNASFFGTLEWPLRTLSGNASITMSMSGSSGSYDVRYTPACTSYPCTRTVTSTAASRQQVVTSFFWRTPTTSFNY